MQPDVHEATAISERLARATHAIGRLSSEHIEARVTAATGVRAVLPPLPGMLSVGDRLEVIGRDGAAVPAQVTSSTAQDTTITLFRDATGLGAGSPARLPLCPSVATLPIGPGWIGRVVDPLGQPLDGRGALPLGEPQPIRRAAPPAATRARVGPAVTLGVRAMDLFTTCRLGQRMGRFAGPGVGKSTLLGMLARWSAFDVVVVALVGERGREVREFLEDDLGPDGRERSLMFVATADATALMRAEAVQAAMAAAEHFRDRGQRVLLLVDSLTRYCHAVREVALSSGELPVARAGIRPACSPSWPACWSGRGRGWSSLGSRPAASPGSSPCWWMATI